MPKILDIPPGSASIPSAVQFGGRHIVCYPDQRPYVVMPGPDGTMKAYKAGIKAPTTAPALATGAASTLHRITGDEAWVAYCFWSEHRRVFSEISPVSQLVAMTGLKLTVDTFEAPRDDYEDQDISHIVVGVQYSKSNKDLRCVWDQMKIDAKDGLWTSKSLTIDFEPSQFAGSSFNLGEASAYHRVPGAFRHCARHGERVWYAGGLAEIDKSGATCSTLNTTWRGQPVCRLTLTNGTWDDGDHARMVFASTGEFLGYIWDVHSSTVAYTERPVPAALNSQNISGITLKSIQDKLWPSAFHSHFVGGVPITIPECVNPRTTKHLPATTDDQQSIRGLMPVSQGLIVLTNEAPKLMMDGTNLGDPQTAFPKTSPFRGVSGAPANRGMAYNSNGDAAWLAGNGPAIWTEGVGTDLAAAAMCSRLFKGLEWVDPASFDDCVVAYYRDFDGWIFGRLTIGGTADEWLIYTRRPQVGFWRMSATVMRSNILEYPGDDGRSVVLVGDATTARLKRILVPGTFTDLDAADDPTNYTWEYRGGWEHDENYAIRSAAFTRLRGIIAPAGTFSITRTTWRGNSPVRNPSHITSAKTHTGTLTETDIIRDVPFSPDGSIYASIAFSGNANTGLANGQPIELTRHSTIFEDPEGQRRQR